MFTPFIFYLESSVKFSQSKYVLLENQEVISIEFVYIGVPETNVSVKLHIGNESSSSNTALGKRIEKGIQVLLNLQLFKKHAYTQCFCSVHHEH